jgi:hypothetical protein
MERQEAYVVQLHETAHAVLLPREEQPAAEADEVADLAALTEWCRDPDRACYEQLPAVYPGWFPSHGREFTRAALHCWWRAALAGVFTPLDGLCAGAVYSMSAAYAYWNALGAEPVRMKDATFAEILATPEPDEFRQWWRADLKCWLQRNPEAKEICDAD